MVKRVFAGVVVVLALSGCTNFGNITRVNSSLDVSQYHGGFDTTLEGRTSVELREVNGENQLFVGLKWHNPNTGSISNERWISFTKTTAADLIPLIDKFNEWDRTAMVRGDQFTKRIGNVARTPDKLGLYQVGFHSIEAYDNVLYLTDRQSGNEYVYSPDQALALKGVLLNFISGEIEHLDVDSIYK